MAESNNLIASIIAVMVGVFVTTVVGFVGWVWVRVNGSVGKVHKRVDKVDDRVDDHDTRLAVVEVMLERIDKNVEKLLEKP